MSPGRENKAGARSGRREPRARTWRERVGAALINRRGDRGLRAGAGHPPTQRLGRAREQFPAHIRSLCDDRGDSGFMGAGGGGRRGGDFQATQRCGPEPPRPARGRGWGRGLGRGAGSSGDAAPPPRSKRRRRSCSRTNCSILFTVE